MRIYDRAERVSGPEFTDEFLTERLRAVVGKAREDKAQSQQVESLRRDGGGGGASALVTTARPKAKAKAKVKTEAKKQAKEEVPAKPTTPQTAPDTSAVGVSGLFITTEEDCNNRGCCYAFDQGKCSRKDCPWAHQYGKNIKGRRPRWRQGEEG